VPRVLGLDLDFFVHEVAPYRESDDERLDAADYPASSRRGDQVPTGAVWADWPAAGRGVEHHGQMFGRWGDLIESGDLVSPFHVTHVDANADRSTPTPRRRAPTDE